MISWGIVPVLAAILLGPGAGGHAALGHDMAERISATSGVASEALVQTTPAPVLQQLANGTWQTTVLVSGTGGTGCPDQQTSASDYTLETTAPAVALIPTGVSPADKPSGADSCEVTLTFNGPGQVPATATLLFNGASPVGLTVSRQVGWFGYLLVPAIFGVVAVLLLLGGCLIFVQVYDEDGKRKTGARRWAHPVRATGAWTLNDSWATNIATLVAVVGTVLGVSSGASELFPGADIGKFVIVIDIAGAIATAVPLLFAVLYAHWSAREPGLTEDASLWLTATLQFSPAVYLPASVHFIPSKSGWRISASAKEIPARSSVTLHNGARAIVPVTSKIVLAGDVPGAILVPGTVVTLQPSTGVDYGRQRTQLRSPTQARLCRDTEVTLPTAAAITPRAPDDLAELPPALKLCLPPGTEVILPGDVTARVTDNAEAVLPAGAAVKVGPDTEVVLGEVNVALPDKTLLEYATELGKVTEPHGAYGILHAAQATLGSIDYGDGAHVRVPSGATITFPWGATACASALGNNGTQPVHVDSGCTVQIPPDSDIRILGAYVTLPGTPDILARGDCILVIRNDTGALTAGATSLMFPVRVTVRSGAKITVTGVGQFSLPKKAVTVTAPRRKTFDLPDASARLPMRIPQGTNTLVGTLRTVVAAAAFTTFSVGAQLGIATLLTTYLAGASAVGLSLTWVISVAIGLFSAWYGVTAIRSLADPQPGSSMSSTAGTSFTL